MDTRFVRPSLALAASLAIVGCRGKANVQKDTATAPSTSASTGWPDVPLRPHSAAGAHAHFTEDAGAVEDFASQLSWLRSVPGAPIDLRTAEQYCAEQPNGPWRLPTRLELLTLLDLTRGAAPLTDPAAFGPVPEGPFWSSTPVVGTPAARWTVSFSTGLTTPSSTPQANVRCVKGAMASAPNPRFRKMGKFVLDEASQLMWTRAPLADAVSFTDSRMKCQTLSLDGVRGFHLPSRVELETLVDARRRMPAADDDALEIHAHEIDWSGNAAAVGAKQAWVVVFDTGETRKDDWDELHTIRCVKPM